MPRPSSYKPTPTEMQEAWKHALPDEAQRKTVAGIMAETIDRAHAISPGNWMIGYRPSRKTFTINVGRIFAVSINADSMSVLLDTDILPDSSIPSNWGGAEKGHRFSVVPEATWRDAPTAETLGAWSQIEESYFSAIEKGARTSSGSPWHFAHLNTALEILEAEIGRSLPRPIHPVSNKAPAADIRDLVEEFLEAYPESDDGRSHLSRYLVARQEFRTAFAEIKEKRAHGKDVTEAVLSLLLPHADTAHNRTRNVWRTVAPVITKDLKQWFENAKWTDPDKWPEVATHILDFFESCEADPDSLESACKKFAENVPSKGFQAAMLSAGLMALNPDRFALINRKPIFVLEHFAGSSHSTDLLDYPRANHEMLSLADLAAESLMDTDSLEGLNAVERFDAFSHWLYAVRKWRPGGIRYWKVAPGKQAWNWETCREQGIITMGWDKFGDVGEMSRKDFEELALRLNAEDKSYKKTGTAQVWTFARDIQPGDRIVANLGKTRVLGIGTVEGSYEFVPDRRHGHQLPVRWDSTTPFDVPAHGWSRTVVSLPEKKFKAILARSENGDVEPDESGISYWLFQANPKVFNLAEEIQKSKPGTLDRWRTTRYQQDIKQGDKVVLWQAGPAAGVYGFAEVVGEPVAATSDDAAADPFIKEKDFFTPIRITQVLEKPIMKSALVSHPLLADTQVLSAPQGTNFRVTADEWAALQALLGEPGSSLPTNPVTTSIPLDLIEEKTGFASTELQRWVNAIERKKQAVLYGPPGTGKTFIAEYLAKHLIGGGDGFVQLVQFHPAYTYEDFIQGLRPEAGKNGGLDYRLVPGRFLEFCEEAARRTGRCVLILDEINRANLARVFGELMYLLEYRNSSIPLAGGKALRVPENVRIIGTMNTADRSIALVDHALRRRFAFISLRPQYQILEAFHADKEYDAEPLVRVLKRLNQAIDDPHYEVGISFFMKDDLRKHLPDIWQMEIEPYLEEYFFDQVGKMKEYSWYKLEGEIG